MNQEINRLRLANLGNLEILAKQVVEGFITGMHKSPFHGFSVEFAEHRIYNKGESSRHVDWKLYGRTDKLFTKKYEEETNLRCQIVIDQSSSMYFPKDGQISKYEFSVYAAASLIEFLKKQRDAVGLTLFDDKINLHTENKTSVTHHNFLYSALEKHFTNYKPENKKGTTLTQCLHDVAELSHKRSMIIVFSDLLHQGENLDEFYNAIQHIKHNKHELIIFNVISKEYELDFNFEDRPYDFVDMESGERLKIQPEEIRDKYQELVKDFFGQIEKKCTGYGVDFIPAYIEEGYKTILLNYLLKRQKMK
jgi:uncharacterized protein (DUF58 family)